MPRVAIGQFEPRPRDEDHNLTLARDACREARDGNAVLLVLPELALTGWLDDADGPRELAQSLDGSLVTAAARMGAEFGVTIIAGLYEHADTGDGRPYNTLAVLDPSKGLTATHRKMHLYDAWGYRESDEVRSGDGDLTLVDVVGDLRVGIINCYEVRFPERANRLVTAGADLLTVSAAWAKGPLKEEHWSLNLRARALENTVWVAGSGTIGPEVTGRSAIVDPLGVVRAELDECSPSVAIVDVTPERTQQARRSLPVLDQRRAAYGARTDT